MPLADWYLSALKLKLPGLEIEIKRVEGSNRLKPNGRAGCPRIALRAFNGMFVSASRHLDMELVADRPEVAAWEIFELVELNDGKFALRAFNPQFVSAKLHLNGELIADRDDVQGWEAFALTTLPDGNVALRAFNSKYVSAKLHERCQLVADRDDVQGWESFVLTLITQ